MKFERFFKQKSIKNALLCVCAVSITAMCGCTSSKTGKEITTVTYWSGNSHSKYVMADLFNDYNRSEGKQNGIYIDYYVKDSEKIDSLVEEAIASGQAPDFYGVYDESLIKSGNALAIDDLPGGKAFLETFDEEDILDPINGKIYGLRIGACTQGMIYNKDMFRKVGIVNSKGEPTPPSTFDEMRDYAKRLTNEDKYEYGIVVPMGWSNWFNSDIVSPSMSSSGFTTYNPNTGRYDYSYIKQVAQYFLDMKKDGSIVPGEKLLDNDQARARFAEGGIGMKMAFSFDVGVLNDQFAAKCDWGAAKYPTIDATVRYPSRMSYNSTSLMNAESVKTVGGIKMMTVLKMIMSDEAIAYSYREGVSIPYKEEIINSVPLGENAKTGWKAFCELVYDSKEEVKGPKYNADELESLGDIFINHVWTGEKNLNEAFDSHEEAVNIAIEAYAEQDGNQ